MSTAKTSTDTVKRQQDRIVTTLDMAIESLNEAVEMVKSGKVEDVRAAALIWKDSVNTLGTLYKRVRGSEGFGQPTK